MAKSNVTPITKREEPSLRKAATPKRRKQIRGKAMPSGFRLDLGCGPACTPGFVGLDRFALDGVSVVADLNGPLPFETETVDYVLASHSLEHVADLPATMAEIFRICRDRAIITIIGPYHATGLNRANVYHSQVFNEHTMRFFTDRAENSHVETTEYAFPHAEVWGLLGSDHSEHDYDIRVLKQEFFYFAPFRGLSAEMKTIFRKTLNDVCDQMLIHAVVVKSPMGEDEEAAMLRNTQFAETESLRYRRQLEEQASEPSIWSALAGMPSNLAELGERNDRFEQELLVLEQQSDKTSARLDEIAGREQDQSSQIEDFFASLEANATSFAEALREESRLRESQSVAYNAENQAVAKRLDELERVSNQTSEELTEGLAAVADTLAEFARTRNLSEAVTDSRFDGVAHGFEGLKQDAQRFVEAIRDESQLRESQSEALSVEQQAVARRLDDAELRSSKTAGDLTAGLATVADTFAEFATARNLSEAVMDSRFDGVAHGFDGLKRDAQRFVDALREEHRLWESHSEQLNSEQQAFSKKLEEIVAVQSQLRDVAELQHAEVEANTRSLAENHHTLEQRFAETERHIHQLSQAAHQQEAASAQQEVEREVSPSLKFRARRYLRQFRRDLSGQVAPAYRSILQNSLVENDITKRHQLLLSQFFANGTVLDFRLPRLAKPLESIETVFSFLLSVPLGTQLVYDVFDPASGTVVFSGAVDLHSPASEGRFTIDLGGVNTDRPSELVLRLFGSPETQCCGMRTYEWRRKRLMPFSGPVERKLFASFNTVAE